MSPDLIAYHYLDPVTCNYVATLVDQDKPVLQSENVDQVKSDQYEHIVDHGEPIHKSQNVDKSVLSQHVDQVKL